MLKRLSFLHWNAFTPLLQIIRPYLCGSLLEQICIVIYQAMCLFFFSYSAFWVHFGHPCLKRWCFDFLRHFPFFKKNFFNPHPRTCLLILGRGERMERGRETSVWKKTLIYCLLRVAWHGPNPQPRYVPWPGIKPVTFWFMGWYPTN